MSIIIRKYYIMIQSVLYSNIEITLQEYKNKAKDFAEFIDTTLALFEGELSITDILSLPKKRLFEMRLARIDRLSKEAKELEDMQKANESNGIRSQILRK